MYVATHVGVHIIHLCMRSEPSVSTQLHEKQLEQINMVHRFVEVASEFHRSLIHDNSNSAAAKQH